MAALVGSFAASSIPRATAAGGPTFVMRRAVNISPGTVYGNFLNGPVADPIYSTNRRQNLPEDYPLIKSMGFDTVRYGVEPSPFTMVTGAKLDELDAFVSGKLEQMLGAGLKVVLDMHTFKPEILGFNASGDVNDPRVQSYLGAVRRFAAIANRYDPSVVALELMNEPHWDRCVEQSGAAWNAYQAALLSTARAVAPRTTFVLTPGCLGGRQELLKLNGVSDSNTLISVHIYEQVEITHQGQFDGGDWYKHIEGLTYPVNPNDRDAVIAKTTANIDKDPALSAAKKAEWKSRVGPRIADLTGKFLLNRSKMAEYVQQIATWASGNGVSPDRIFIGEFGVIHKALDDPAGTHYPDTTSRINWYRDVRELLEQQGFTWAVFNYAGKFGILENITMDAGQPRVLAPEMRDALGINDIGGTPPPPPVTTLPPTVPPPPPVPTTVAPPPPVPAGVSTFNIRSACNKDLLLDVRKLSMVPGGVVQVYWPNRTTNQQFRLLSQGDNRYRIAAVHSGLVIGADSDSEGQSVVQKALTTASADDWLVTSVDGGFVEFARANSGLKLDVLGASKVPGTTLQLWRANGSCAQRFRLEPVPPS
jgi:endoglucanase